MLMLRVLLIISFLAAWFLPLIIAALYKLPHQGPIAVLSLLLGWTGVGWLAALVIVVGGAIRATRPTVQDQEQRQGSGPAQAHPPVPSPWTATTAPVPAHTPGAQGGERSPGGERAPGQVPPPPWPHRDR